MAASNDWRVFSKNIYIFLPGNIEQSPLCAAIKGLSLEYIYFAGLIMALVS